MLMLSAHEVTREELSRITTPPPTDTWRPIPHAEAVNTLIERANARGLKIRNERYAVLPGALYLQPGMQITLEGARLFGSLDFEPLPGMTFPFGCTPSAGIRNSHDKSLSLSILSGARVLVCANGVLAAEHVVNRKHTSGIDLIQSIDQALDAFMASIRDFQITHERLRCWRLTRMKAESLAVSLARAGAFSSSDILPVLDEFIKPRHAEFADRSAWSLYQAATERMKTQSPSRQLEGFKSLNSVLLPAMN